MSLAWMAFVAALIAVEKLLPVAPGRRPTARRPSCSRSGVLLLAAPDAIPGLTVPAGPMAPMMS